MAYGTLRRILRGAAMSNCELLAHISKIGCFGIHCCECPLDTTIYHDGCTCLAVHLNEDVGYTARVMLNPDEYPEIMEKVFTILI